MKEKRYKALKQKQKARISEKMFMSVCEYYREHGSMPENEDFEKLSGDVCNKIMGMGYGVPVEEIADVFLKKQERFTERIQKNGVPEPPAPKKKKTEKEKLAMKRLQRKRRKQRNKAQVQDINDFQDDTFFCIAGYTSGGAAYGVTWEEMGLEPWEKLE